jgi:hypothetical protein
MDKHLASLFIGEIDLQCRFALAARDDLERALQEHKLGDDPYPVWRAIQSVVLALGNLDRLVFPKKPGSMRDATALRRFLNVPDSSPLQGLRFRNHFEHYDERLEDWYKKAPHHLSATSIIAPFGSVTGLSPVSSFRQFDPDTYTVGFWEDRLELLTILPAVESLAATTAALRNVPHWQLAIK